MFNNLREDEELSSSSGSARVADLREEEEEQTIIPYQNTPEPKRNERTIVLPKRYETNIIVSDMNDKDPTFFKEVMVSSDKEKW